MTKGERSFVCMPMETAGQENGHPITLPMAPVKRKEVIYVPLRPLIQAFGGTVTFRGQAPVCTVTVPGASALRVPIHQMRGTLQAFLDNDTELYAINLDGSGLRRLTYDTGVNGVPAFSPDGAWCAYTAGGNLYVASMAGGEARCLYTATVRADGCSVMAREPAFSGDGALVYFHEQNFAPNTHTNPFESRIFHIRRDGTEQQLVAEGRELRVSPDGTLLAYSDQGNIHLRTVADGADRIIGKGWWMAFSRDSHRLAYTDSTHYFHCTAVYEIAGPKAGTTYNNPENTMEAHPEQWPCFTPDGTQVLYADKRDGLCLMNADRSNLQLLTKGNGNDEFPVFTGDGKLIVFYRQGQGLFTVQADGQKMHRLNESITKLDYDEGLVLSPDGMQILFTMAP